MYIRHSQKLFIVFLLVAFCQITLAKDIESYVKIPCNEANATLCECVKSLHEALVILEKIQKHNFKLMQQQTKKQAQEGTNTHIKEAKDMQKDDIFTITIDEYHALRNNMQKFCQDFKNLSDKEQKVLFALEWNKKALFQNRNDVARFCKNQM